MSVDTVKAFFEKAGTDEVLQSKVRAIYQKSARATAEELSALAKEVGIPITAEEFISETQEISDTELDNVSGGVRISNQKNW